MGRKWWRALAEDVFGVVLFLVGCVVIATGLAGGQDAVAKLAIGAGLLLAGAFSSRLRSARVGPAGAEIELDQRARETTSRLAVDPAPAAGGPFPLPAEELVIDTHRVALANDVVAMLTAPRSGPLVGRRGVEASDETFALSTEKQARYSDLAVVAAMPVTNAAGHVLAVLSAASSDPDSGLRTDAGMDALVALADAVARVLVDLLKWFPDYVTVTVT